MITKDSIETAYSFLHQKRNVYIHSSLDWQKDDIEYAIASYADDMSRELYDAISGGSADFLRVLEEGWGGSIDFTDVLLLLKIDGEWKCVAKAYNQNSNTI